MTRARWAALTIGGVLAAGVGLPAGALLGLAGTAVLAPKDFPPYPADPGSAVAPFFVPGRSGAVPLPPAAPQPALRQARAKLLAAHSRFLRRERHASALLDRYRPTVIRTGRRATPALLAALERTAKAHARARDDLAAEPMPQALARARGATLRMLRLAEAALQAVTDAGRRRDPNFALLREEPFSRALGEHYAALAALHRVTAPSVEARLAAPGS